MKLYKASYIKKNLSFPHVLPLLFNDSRYAWDIDSDGHPTPTPSLLLTAIHAYLSCIFQKDCELDLS